MDYDDIEFQSQNFELVVEDNNKFPQSLHSFSLPKFDIDEHLEVHHTFDSLAETEVLLDIQHQENNWIEDFSPRNSAVEFSSSAAESCSFPRQNNVWSEATSSEPVEMLLKSVGEHEMANHQVINKVTDAQTFNDSNNSRMMEPLPNDSSLLPSAKCDNSISRSNENVDKGQKQFEGFSQSPKDGTSPVELDRSSLGEKSSSDGQAISEQCIIDDKLTSSSDCAKKEHPVVDESLRIYRSDIPVENSFIQGSDDDRGASNLPPRSTPVSLVCNTTQNAPSSVSTDNTSMGPENMKTQSCLIEEYHEIDISGKLEVVQCDKLQNAESWISVTGDKVNDKDLHVHSVNNDSCNLEDFSFIEPPMCSSTLLNEGLRINRSDGLLQSIAYQANVFNKENGTAVIVSSSAKNLPSLAIEKEGNVRHPIETSNEDMAGLLHMSDGSINASHIETEYQVKDDSLHQSALPTKSANIDFGAERGTANFDAIFAERQELKAQYLTKTELETGCTQVNNDNKVEVDPVMLSTKKLEPDVMVKSTEVGVAKDSTDITKSSPDTKKLDSLENSTLCVSGKEVKVSAVADGKSIIESIELTVVSDTCETNINHLQMPVNINQILPPSTDPCDSSATEDCPHVMKKMKAHSSLDQRNVDLSLVGDKSSMTSSTATHEHSEVMLACNTVAELGGLSASSLTASVCNEKDVNMSSLSVTNSNLDTHMLNQPFREPDAVVKSSPKDRILDVSVNLSLVGDKSSMTSLTATHEHSEVMLACNSVAELGGLSASSLTASVCNEKGVNMSSLSVTNSNLGTHMPNQPFREPDAVVKSSPKDRILDVSGASESHLVEPGSSKQGSVQPNSSSPAGTNSKYHSPDKVKDHEVGKGSPDDAGSNDIKSHLEISTFHDSKESNKPEDDQSFMLEVGLIEQLSRRDAVNNTKSFTHSEQSQDSQGSHKELEENTKRKTIAKTTGENKSKQSSDHATRKVRVPKGDAKEKPQSRHGKRKEKDPCKPSPVADKTISSKAQMEILQQKNTYTGGSSISFPQTVQMANLPDLNTSATGALFHKPFTDIQQVQLRAQIFVYGSLIQGGPPDEACMVAAFGEEEGGRSLWEGAWLTATERFRKHKSLLTNPEIPFHISAGTLDNEQGTKFTPPQSKVLNSPAFWSANKAVGSALANPSPLWSVCYHDGSSSNISRGTNLDFSSAASPVNPYQSSHIRQYASNTSPWLSQSPQPASRTFSSHPQIDAGLPHSATKTVQATAVGDSSLPCTSSVQHLLPVPLLPNQGSASVITTSSMMVESPKKIAKPTNTKSPSDAQKSRKTKKVLLPEEPGTVPLASQSQQGPAPIPVIHPPTSSSFHLTLNSPINGASNALVSATSHAISPNYYQIMGIADRNQTFIFSDKTCARIEDSKVQAEEAAGHAAAAVRHSEGVWGQLATQVKSGLVSELEVKLASAAVATAAAASVAKAAAEAAKVASEAALQAKMMADEALNSVKTGSSTQHDIHKNLARLGPSSILKGRDNILGTSSVICAASEVSRKRIETACAAAKRAQNLDAILKAAELAAEAVSQAGIIIANGDALPSSLSELVEAGPDKYRKIENATDKKHNRTDDVHCVQPASPNVVDDNDKSTKQFNEQPSGDKGKYNGIDVGETLPNDELDMHSGEQLRVAGVESASVSAQADKLQGVTLSNNMQSHIQKGSLVEILADERGLGGVWFSAWVLDVKDDKAYVCYTDLCSDEGPVQLKEWLSLEHESNQVPRMRIAHPFTTAKYEATKKRCREVVGNYDWAVGDMVDAWIQDGWWEGIITEKSQGDDTKLTVNFPARGGSLVVRAWDLRPSLVWKDGQWIMWSRTNKQTHIVPDEGDIPHGKRQRLGKVEAANNLTDDGRGVGTLSRNMHLDDSRKHKEAMAVNLSTRDRTLSVGKNVKDVNADAVRVRTGLQKEGSKVVIGVPKPGKRRKFMEVSKHYVSDKTGKASEAIDSVKFTEYLIPHESHPSKNAMKGDTKGKRAINSKPRGMKVLRSQNIQGANTLEKDITSVSTVDASNDGECGIGSFPDIRVSSFCNEDSTGGKKSSSDIGSLTNFHGIPDNQIIESSKQAAPGVELSRNKPSIADGENKGQLFPRMDNPVNSEVKGSQNPRKAAADAAEPRRSNRRIQPTSRLLEGLQSSLIISKIPGVSHDKGTKTLNKGLSSSKGQSHS